MKVRPTPALGVLVLVAYLAAFYGVWILTDVDYPRVGDSADTLLRWYVAPLAAGAVVLVVAATALGWWRPALTETRRAPRWTLVTPALMAALAVVVLATKTYEDTTGRMLVYLLLGSLGVGFCEELATRGLLLVGLRGALTEGRAWFLSTLLFGLLHLPNWVFGAGPAATAQVVLAFLSGTTLYLVRRGTGSLLPAMAVHGLWDFSVFIGDDPSSLSLLNNVLGAASVVVVLVLLRRERRDRAATLAPYAAPAAGRRVR